jgi:hypothetical protein
VFTSAHYGGGVSKDQQKATTALHRWREAEHEYLRAAAAYLGDGDAPELRKDDLVAMVSLREKADRWREKYFKRQGR